jgi:hypothetical protein
MTSLRADFIGPLQLKGFPPRSITTYVSTVAVLAAFHRRSPMELSTEQIRAFLLYELNENKNAARTVHLPLGNCFSNP